METLIILCLIGIIYLSYRLGVVDGKEVETTPSNEYNIELLLEQNKELSELLESANNEVARQQEHLEQCDSEYMKVLADVENLNKDVNRLTEKLREVEGNAKYHKDEWENATLEVENLMEQLDKFRINVDELQCDKQSLQRDIDSLSEELSDMQEERDNLNELLSKEIEKVVKLQLQSIEESPVAKQMANQVEWCENLLRRVPLIV